MLPEGVIKLRDADKGNLPGLLVCNLTPFLIPTILPALEDD